MKGKMVAIGGTIASAPANAGLAGGRRAARTTGQRRTRGQSPISARLHEHELGADGGNVAARGNDGRKLVNVGLGRWQGMGLAGFVKPPGSSPRNELRAPSPACLSVTRIAPLPADPSPVNDAQP